MHELRYTFNFYLHDTIMSRSQIALDMSQPGQSVHHFSLSFITSSGPMNLLTHTPHSDPLPP